MAIMKLDSIETPEGPTIIEDIIIVGINQHRTDKIYFFTNGMSARTSHDKYGVIIGSMRFKASEPASAWCNDQNA
jgi:hypothetical protein